MGRAATAAPAGFWHRAAAWSIDAACIAPLAMLLGWRWLHPASVHLCEATEALLRLAGELAARAIVDGTPLHGLAIALMHDPRITDATATLQLATWRWLLPASFAFGLVGAAWHVAGERSRWQGSPGKRLLGLRVTSRDGATPSLARSAWRHLAGTASWA
ncbi:RDD family protein, partial [Lysobacter zhanggongensis]